jgi:outer membrane protein OmpA-like peptidoglycan-associated protein
LQPGGQRSALQLTAVLQQYPARRVLIEGFTDNQGDAQMNLELSQRRAEAFRQALLAAGGAASRIDAQGQGEAYPAADNNTPERRQQNRRVEVLSSDGEGRIAGR